MKLHALVDIGCIECGEDTEIVGVFESRTAANKAQENGPGKDGGYFSGGQHRVSVFDVDVPWLDDPKRRTRCRRTSLVRESMREQMDEQTPMNNDDDDDDCDVCETLVCMCSIVKKCQENEQYLRAFLAIQQRKIGEAHTEVSALRAQLAEREREIAELREQTMTMDATAIARCADELAIIAGPRSGLTSPDARSVLQKYLRSTHQSTQETRMPRENDPDKQRGLYRKFEVRRTDPDAQRRHEHCDYFVLDTAHDALALPALVAYEVAARDAGYIALADDLRVRLNSQQRLSAPVSEPQPETKKVLDK